MKQLINKMKNNLSSLRKESPFYYSNENNRSKKDSINLKKLLQENFKKIKNIKCSSIQDNIENNDKLKTDRKTSIKFNILNYSNIFSKNNLSLFDLTQISPAKKLEYELALYEQKEKIVKKNEDKKINIPNKKKLFFIRKNNSIKNIYNNSNKSCILFSKKKINSNLMKNNCEPNFLLMSPNTTQSYTSKIFSTSSKNLKSERKKIKNKIDETIKEVNDSSANLHKDIILSNRYDKINNINNLNNSKEKNKKNKSCINIKEIKKELRLNEDAKTYYKKNMERRFKYMDQTAKQILRESIYKVKNEDRLLNKNNKSKFPKYDNKKAFIKLINEIKENQKDILLFKKKYKGINAIEPINESEYIHKLIKENMYDSKKNEQIYFDEIINRNNNINRCFNSSDINMKRINYLHKKNKSKHKNYQYMNK